MFALLLLAVGAEPAPRFEVVNRTIPAFTVVNRVPAEGHTGPAPAGLQWQKVGAGPWQLVPVAAPAVAVPRPFRAGSIPGTLAPVVPLPSSSFPGATETGRIHTLVPGAARFGVTADCGPLG